MALTDVTAFLLRPNYNVPQDYNKFGISETFLANIFIEFPENMANLHDICI